MRALGSTDILELTERVAGLGPARRALLALAAAYPEHAPEAIAATPLSARDRALLVARALMLGAAMTARDQCDACGEAIELTLTAEAIGLAEADEPFPPAPAGRIGPADAPLAIRAVTAGDVAAAETAPDTATARAILAARVAPGADTAEELDAALEALDPTAEVEIALACPACGETTLRAFDAAAFFWRELEARAPRILREVAELARVYHWTEQDILAMSPARRAFYLAEARA